jgi:hypothetical protein
MTPRLHTALALLTTLFCISASAQDTTNQGTEFWVGYGHHWSMDPAAGNTQEMTLYISTGSQPAVVTVTIDSSGTTPAVASTWWTRTFNIPANTAIDIQTSGSTIPKSGGYDARLYSDAYPFGNSSVGIFRQKAIHIQSNVPVVAYAHIYSSTSSGATMLVPVEAWGGTYTAANSNQSYNSNPTATFSWLYVIAKYDNTVIEITPSVKTRAQNLTGLQPGVTKTITLMRGQIYQVAGANLGSDADGNGGTNNAGYELTGTKVNSVLSPTGYIHPIGVFSGSSRTLNIMSCGSAGGDNDMQQHFPRQALGKIYVTAPTMQYSTTPSAAYTMMNAYKVVVTDPATVVTRNGVPLTSLVNNSYYTFESSTADVIEADQPILVAQFMGGGPCTGGVSYGDPEMFYLNPVSQAINSATFYRTSNQQIYYNYLILTLPTTGLASLAIDGSSVFDYTYAHPNMPGYTVVLKRWAAAAAQVSVQSTVAFTGLTYGMGPAESYGYSLGTRLNAVNARDASVLPPGFTGSVFPLTLIDFAARKNNSDVILTWKTANEKDVDRFELERSPNGTEFNRIAALQPQLTSSAAYQYNDKEVLRTFASSSSIFYRLKMIDKDGKFKYSSILSVRPGKNSTFQVQAAPNPFTDKLALQVHAETAGAAKIVLRSIAGTVMESISKYLQAGSTAIEIRSAAALPKGVYILEVEMNGTKQYCKVVK